MKHLHLAPRFALPVDVAGEAIAILAKRGAGKTNTATVLVEELVDADVQVVIVDPVGASATSSAFANNLGRLRSLGLVTYPRPGWVAAAPVLFLEG